MHQHPWRIVRALRVLLACLVLMLPAAPARSAPAVPDTVLIVAYAATASQVAAAAREVAPQNAEAPRVETEAAPTKAPSFGQASAFSSIDPDAALVRVTSPRWLLHCALLC